MNFRRGMWRLWLAVSAVWVIAVAILSYSSVAEEFQKYFEADDFDAYVSLVPVQCGNARGTPADYTTIMENRPGPWQKYRLCWYELPKFRTLWPEYADLSEDQLTDMLYAAVELQLNPARPWHKILYVSEVAIVPPLGLLGLGAVVGWVAAGFKRKSA